MIRYFSSRSLAVATLLVLTVGQTACLKTRAQLREEGDEPTSSAPVPLKQAPQDVAPQGGYAVDELKSEVTRMSGRIEDLERAHKAQASAGNPTAEEVKKLQARVNELEQAQANMLEAIKKMQENPPAAADPADILKKAKAQADGGELEAAIETYGACLKTAKGKTAEECVFGRAECHYGMKDYKKAIVDYSKFPEKYTKSPLMPKALFRIGQSFEALHMKEDAKGFYQELIEKYPKSPEAKKAKPKAK